MNNDCETLTFIGIYLDRSTRALMNPYTETRLADNITNADIPSINGTLFIEILKQKFPIFENFNKKEPIMKIRTLRTVMDVGGIGKSGTHPDTAYELTMDNCLKMMAIFLRFVCNIPVVSIVKL